MKIPRVQEILLDDFVLPRHHYEEIAAAFRESVEWPRRTLDEQALLLVDGYEAIPFRAPEGIPKSSFDGALVTRPISREELVQVMELLRGVPDDSGVETGMIDVAPVCAECDFRHAKWVTCWAAYKQRWQAEHGEPFYPPAPWENPDRG